eukprot:TRINITY_DN26071_c0_g1_i6.p2 TRINITY_DN26071_c0_g1~~TRINITY_DN26071_c0_g1_i6.p2  ORF type:complete len:131 (+),score=36.00 TRINITY_DN26071_c0_g1_i6:204-596(+)
MCIRDRPGMQPRSEWVLEAGRLAGCDRVYTAGWLKRGPSGIIGTNIPCAKQTCDSLLQDEAAGLLPPGGEGDEVVKQLLAEKGHQLVSWEDWLAIERHETAQGIAHAKVSEPPREKVVDVNEMLAIARSH